MALACGNFIAQQVWQQAADKEPPLSPNKAQTGVDGGPMSSRLPDGTVPN